VPAQPVDATPSAINLFSKGGVYGATETGEAFREPADGHVGPLEGGTVVTRDRAGLWQESCGRSLPVDASWRDCSGRVGARCSRLHWRSERISPAVSSQRCRSASLGVGLAAQDLGFFFPSISERKVEIFLNVENNRTLYSSTTYAPPC
jgi:hypothetical protein